MRQLIAVLKQDVRVQARAKLYGIGIAVAVALGLMGRLFFDPAHAGSVLAGFYLLGIGGTTYMFGASLVLLEKSDGTLLALRVTPLTSQSYMASKAITLTSFALIESVIVYAIAFFGVWFNPIPLALGIFVLGTMYTFVGLGQVAPHTSVTSFLIPDAMVVMMILQLPALFILHIGPDWLWYLIPTQAPLLLMLAAFEPIELWQWVYAVVVSGGSVGLAMWWSKRRFARHIGLQEG